MRRGWKSAIGVAGVLALVAAILFGTDFGRGIVMSVVYRAAGLTSTRVTLPGVFFRYKTVIRVDGTEDVVFDNVVACSTRITRSKANGSSVLAGMTPNLFIRRTKDNHAVLVTTPSICSSVRGKESRYTFSREGFLPPAVVWFDDADDLTFGIAYVTQTAYESPKSRLEVISTYVGPATPEEFEAWYDGPRKENLAKQEWINPPPGTTRARWDAFNAYGAKALATRGRAFPIGCFGAQRFALTAEGSEIIRAFWPEDRPRYWTPTPKEWTKLFDEQFTGKSYFIGKSGRTNGSLQFWDDNIDAIYGPRIDGRNGEWPAETYPAANSRNATFLTEDATDKDYFLQKIFFENGANDGFAWCYAAKGTPSRVYTDPLRRHYYANVDEHRVRSTDGFKNEIQFVFEREQHMFRFFHFSIHPSGGIE
ncbi:MAG: hypothetical protein C0606_11975 [Hyphomicrobiales bacterium]|nr:MAG: hypothetical protein C0606_11975 [Hyphomicrobiales bacterium]